ncbi:MAG: hypothetical protein CMN30_25445 [Sandaracinus sp.]|nr:hypothetical protein [Sandaracinus sp.]
MAEPSVVRSLPAICAFSRYELLGRLAVGGMAEIYLAREPETVRGAGHRTLVIKRVLPHVADDPAFVDMFFNEARLAMRLRHPAIVHIYEFGEEAGSYYLAMEWVDGVALGKIIRRARKENGIPPAIAVKLAATVAEALDYAHRARGDDGEPLGIVHRDVSPQNIMVSYEGAVKLLDFGIAKADDESLTQDGQVKGKFAYMSPQQCMGERIDGRADVFALGVCLYEALTGRPLYHRKTQYETMRAVMEDPVPSVRALRPDVPESLDAVVGKALAKDPDDRYATAGEMQIALERWLMEQGEVVPQARMADFLDDLFGEEVGRGPMVDSKPFGASFADIPVPKDVLAAAQAARQSSLPPPVTGPTSSGAGAMVIDTAAFTDDTVPPPARSRMPLVAALVVGLILLLGIGGFAVWKMQGEPPQQMAQGAPGAVANATPPPVGSPAVSPAAPTEVLAAPTERGSLVVRSEPAGAEVTLDGERLPGTTPLMAGDLAAGTYTVAVTLAGRQPHEEEITIAAGEETSVEPRLRAMAAIRAPRRRAPSMRETMAAAPAGRGTLSVNTRPWSKVYVGGQLLGTTPIGRAAVNSGTVRVQLVDRDGNEHTRSVQVGVGEDARVFWDLR